MIALQDIVTAAEKIAPHSVYTPLLESDLLNQQLGGRVLFKAECLQRTGAFKIRGALNKLLSLSEAEKAKGIIAYSSGNHAQAVALASQLLNIDAKIIIPEDAPKLKINNTRAYGAEVILYNRYTESREQLAQDVADQEGRVLVPPYNDIDVITGQATVGLEISQQLDTLGIQADALLCPCGGGGLMAGLSSAIRFHSKEMAIYSVEPEGFDDTKRSLESGEILSIDPEQRSICDSIVTPCPGTLTFPINQKNLTGGLVVTDTAVKQALKVAYTQLKLTVEPGASVGLAALLSGEFDATNKTVVVVLSGGNIDIEDFHRIIHDTADES
ncbi:MAG: threonine dehydratase [Saprospiraceae bacterium]|jgi:threonine dehydratase